MTVHGGHDRRSEAAETVDGNVDSDPKQITARSPDVVQVTEIYVYGKPEEGFNVWKLKFLVLAQFVHLL